MEDLLLSNESVIAELDHVSLIRRQQGVFVGDLLVTPYRLLFISRAQVAGGCNSERATISLARHELPLLELHSWSSGAAAVRSTSSSPSISSTGQRELVADIESISIPLGDIDKVIKTEGISGPQGKYYAFQVYCKSPRSFLFSSTPLSSKFNPAKVKARLQTLIFSENPMSFAASHANLAQQPQPAIEQSLLEDYQRLGLGGGSTNVWRILAQDDSYSLCPTYPRHIVVPAALSDDEIEKVANYRSRRRLPAVVWKHPKGNSVIARCSQPTEGVGGAHCKADETYLRKLYEMQLVGIHPLYILDARPYANAMANKLRGGGIENLNRYQNCKMIFLNIANIHALRHAFLKLRKICNKVDMMNPVKPKYADQEWHDQVSKLLRGALKGTELIVGDKCSLLIHCSDGWDRTPQLTSLIQLLLDPYYRTIEGFISLISKEWVAFGHKFEERIGQNSINWKSKERAAVFILFLDAVWQVLVQFPQLFEFNDNFLLSIALHATSCRFGTFLFNSERERVENRVYETCQCLWQHLTQPGEVAAFKSNCYTPVRCNARCVCEKCVILELKTAPAELSIWKYFFPTN